MLDQNDLQAIQAMMQAMLQPINDRFDNLEIKVNNLEKQVERNTTITENTVNKCIQVLGEGYQAANEKLDSLDLNTLNAKIDRAILLSEFANDKVDRLKDDMNKSA